MRDITEQINAPRRDPLGEIMGNLKRRKERAMLEELDSIRIERLPEGDIKEQLLDLRSRVRRHFNFTVPA